MLGKSIEGEDPELTRFFSGSNDDYWLQNEEYHDHPGITAEACWELRWSHRVSPFLSTQDNYRMLIPLRHTLITATMKTPIEDLPADAVIVRVLQLSTDPRSYWLSILCTLPPHKSS